MSVYIPTLHSKIRYYERVDSNYNHRDEDVRLAIKYGLKIKDIPKKHNKERQYLGNKKIFYNDTIYVFSNSQYRVLITVYPYYSPILKGLLEKKETIRKEAKKERKEKYKLEQGINQYEFKETEKKIETNKSRVRQIEVKDVIKEIFVMAEKRMFKITIKNDKISKIKEIMYEQNLKITIHPIANTITKILNGEFQDVKELLNFDDFSESEKALYDELFKIPYGKAITRKKLADNLKNKFTVQEITAILDNSPFLFLIPSHRVFRSDTKIGSYCFDFNLKKKLLKNEKIKFKR